MGLEYEAGALDGPLKQGDVFVWQDRYYQRPWNSFGVVVTADCDIKNEKTYGKLSYVPGLLAEDYVWTFLRTKKFMNEREKALKRICSTANKRLIAKGRILHDMSAESISAWVDRVGTETFIVELGLTDNGQISDLRGFLMKYECFRDVLIAKNPDLKLLKRCFEMKSGKTLNGSDIFNELKGELLSLPGDVFHLSSSRDHNSGGIFLMLRYITQCDVGDVAVRPSELRFGSAKARRIGRIAAPYRYALTQNLARVFSDIGLPDVYTTNRQESLVTLLSKED